MSARSSAARRHFHADRVITKRVVQARFWRVNEIGAGSKTTSRIWDAGDRAAAIAVIGGIRGRIVGGRSGSGVGRKRLMAKSWGGSLAASASPSCDGSARGSGGS